MLLRQRKRIAPSKFVYPPGSRVGGKHGKYPIDTKARALAALSYSARHDTAGSYATVSRAVKKAWPSIDVGSGR